MNATTHDVTAPAGPLTGQVALITGAGRGLGRACALHLAALRRELVRLELPDWTA